MSIESTKRKMASLQQADARDQARLDLLKERLEKEHGVRTPAQAKKKIAQLQTDREKIEKELVDGYAAFENDWGDWLGSATS